MQTDSPTEVRAEESNPEVAMRNLPEIWGEENHLAVAEDDLTRKNIE
jgi:hypothetical protein